MLFIIADFDQLDFTNDLPARKKLGIYPTPGWFHPLRLWLNFLTPWYMYNQYFSRQIPLHGDLHVVYRPPESKDKYATTENWKWNK